MASVPDLVARAAELRGMAARAKRLVRGATLSPEDMQRLLKFADELEREAAELDAAVAAARED